MCSCIVKRGRPSAECRVHALQSSYPQSPQPFCVNEPWQTMAGNGNSNQSKTPTLCSHSLDRSRRVSNHAFDRSHHAPRASCCMHASCCLLARVLATSSLSRPAGPAAFIWEIPLALLMTTTPACRSFKLRTRKAAA